MIDEQTRIIASLWSCRTAPDVPATSVGDALPSRTVEKEPGQRGVVWSKWDQRDHVSRVACIAWCYRYVYGSRDRFLQEDVSSSADRIYAFKHATPGKKLNSFNMFDALVCKARSHLSHEMNSQTFPETFSQSAGLCRRRFDRKPCCEAGACGASQGSVGVQCQRWLQGLWQGQYLGQHMVGWLTGSHGLQVFGISWCPLGPEVKIWLKPYIKLFWLVVNAWDTYLWANRCLAEKGWIYDWLQTEKVAYLNLEHCEGDWSIWALQGLSHHIPKQKNSGKRWIEPPRTILVDFVDAWSWESIEV